MNRPNYKLLLSGLSGMREVAAIRTRAARDEALKRARTPEVRSHIESLFYDEVRQNRAWFDDQEAFLRACIELEEGKEVSIPKRTKKPTQRIAGSADYDSLLSPLELVDAVLGAVLGAVLPPEVQAIMQLVVGLIDGQPSPKRTLVIGQIQVMLMDIYMRTEQADRADGARVKSSVKRALSP